MSGTPYPSEPESELPPGPRGALPEPPSRVRQQQQRQVAPRHRAPTLPWYRGAPPRWGSPRVHHLGRPRSVASDGHPHPPARPTSSLQSLRRRPFPPPSRGRSWGRGRPFIGGGGTSLDTSKASSVTDPSLLLVESLHPGVVWGPGRESGGTTVFPPLPDPDPPTSGPLPR